MLPAQFDISQLRVSVAGPRVEQSSPPFNGAGLVQLRVRVWFLSPQVVGHSDQFAHIL